eukprot:NODE_188_length_15619_cov_0.374871.p3 type:complete len:442 gc:universal NODE_188_length_15619_cov_0.374871:5339-4014(-)
MDTSSVLLDLNKQSLCPIILEGFDSEGIFAQLEMNFDKICKPIKSVRFPQELVNDDISSNVSENKEVIEEFEQPKIESEHHSSSDSDIYTGADDEFFSMKEMKRFVEAQEKPDEDLESDLDSEEVGMQEEEYVDYNNLTFNDFFEDRTETPLDSKYNQDQMRLKQKILDIEKNNLMNYLPESKPFALKGETYAKDRERDTLLTMDIEHDTAKKPMPDSSSFNIEALIKERVANLVFDNLERKVDVDTTHTEDPKSMRVKKRFDIEKKTQKSEKTLAQIYEEEYLKRENADLFGVTTSEERPKEHVEIENMWDLVEEKLNMLTNSFYRPKAYSNEISIEDQTNIISKEDIQPAAHQEAQSEVVRFKTEFKSANEMTQEDKHALRRKKKANIKKFAAKKALINKVLQSSKPNVLKKEKKDVLSELMQSSNVAIADKTGKLIKK